jgi:hypothetical protein
MRLLVMLNVCFLCDCEQFALFLEVVCCYQQVQFEIEKNIKGIGIVSVCCVCFVIISDSWYIANSCIWFDKLFKYFQQIGWCQVEPFSKFAGVIGACISNTVCCFISFLLINNQVMYIVWLFSFIVCFFALSYVFSCFIVHPWWICLSDCNCFVTNCCDMILSAYWLISLCLKVFPVASLYFLLRYDKHLCI